MQRVLLLILLCLAVAVQAGEKPQPEFAMTATGDLEIGPDGSVQSWKMDSDKLGASVKTLLQRNVEQWRFEPIVVAGKPVIAKTRMTVELSALPQADGYLMKVSNVYFGSLKSRGKLAPSRYPAEAIRAHVGARVLLLVKVDAAGDVVAVHPYQTSLSKRAKTREAEHWRRAFERASIQAVSQWKYEPGETIGGVASSQTLFVPMTFTLVSHGDSPANRWKGYVPGPIVRAPWADADSVARVDPIDLDDGQVAALDSPFKLRSKVVGEAL